MRKMRKFADGGSDKYKAKYDRKVADIESDYQKAMKGKTGRAAEVAKAKYEQRMADAKDDLAKWTKSDRTETRAAEKSAERNLSMTRKFGAMKSAVKSDDVAKTGPTDDVLKSAPKPQVLSKASDTKPTRRVSSAPTRRAPVKQETKPKATLPDTFSQRKGSINIPPAPQRGITFGKRDTPKPKTNLSVGQTAYNTRVAQMRADQAQRERWRNVEREGEANKKLEAMRRRAERPGANFLEKRSYEYAKKHPETITPKFASGGAVKKEKAMMDKKKKSMPPQPTPAERAASKRQDASLKKAKPVPGNAGAIARGNRSSGYAKGGKTKCYAKGGSVSSRADGCAVKGKTKAKMVTMSKGGNY